MPRRLTLDKWVERAKKKHGNKFDYSEVEYQNGVTEVKIRCPEHGPFFQTPDTHAKGGKCPNCPKITPQKQFSFEVASIIKSKWDSLPKDKRGAKIGVARIAKEYGVSGRTIYDIGKGKYFQKKIYPTQRGLKLSDFPDAFSKWDSDSNPSTIRWYSKRINPGELSASSQMKFNWKCKEGHTWNGSVGRITRGDGCPYCSGRKASDQNSLLLLRPDIAESFHPTLNGNISLDKISYGSSKNYWWICNEDESHVWQSSPANRTSNKGKCPFCVSQKINESNCLATLDPELSQYWHQEKNGKHTPFTISPRSNRTFWWKCPVADDHIWEAKPNMLYKNRKFSTGGALGCPCCAGKKISVTNSLSINFPEIADQWHPTKNLDRKVEDALMGSQIKTWWKCKEGPDHEWETNIDMRTKQNTGCPYCCNRLPSVTNSLSTLNPAVASEWHPTKNGNKTPDDFPAGSNKKVWWICKNNKNHFWKTSIVSRTTGERGCPGCNVGGFDPTKTGQYYVIRIKNEFKDTLAYKGGISNDYERRFIEHQSKFLSNERSMNWTIEIVDYFEFEDGNLARHLETKLLRSEIRAPDMKRISSELFLENPLDYARSMKWC